MSDFFNRIGLNNWSNEITKSLRQSDFQSRTKYIVYETLQHNNIDATDSSHHGTVPLV